MRKFLEQRQAERRGRSKRQKPKEHTVQAATSRFSNRLLFRIEDSSSGVESRTDESRNIQDASVLFGLVHAHIKRREKLSVDRVKRLI